MELIFYCVINRLKVLYLGGNLLTEIPAEVGLLKQLQALVLSENALECLPSTVVQLKKLRSLLLHKNRLTTLPPQIVTLKALMEVSIVVDISSCMCFLMFFFTLLVESS
jgi:Leucine-rich repeat (LRR) protein